MQISGFHEFPVSMGWFTQPFFSKMLQLLQIASCQKSAIEQKMYQTWILFPTQPLCTAPNFLLFLVQPIAIDVAGIFITIDVTGKIPNDLTRKNRN